MKSAALLMIGIALLTVPANAQFKSQMEHQPSVAQSLVHPATSINSFMGILNPANFSMRHSLSMSFISAGGIGMSMASYTNSMKYKIADPLDVRFDLTLQGSPFGNYGSLQQRDFSKLFVSRAQLNYHPLDNMFIRLEYDQLPPGGYYFDGYRSSLMYGEN